MASRRRRSTTDEQLPPAKKQCIYYICEACKSSYTTKRALVRHFHGDQHRLNVGLPPADKFACSQCGRNFSREHDRQRHENETHRGIKRPAPRQKKAPTPSPSPPAPDGSRSWFDDDSSDSGDEFKSPPANGTPNPVPSVQSVRSLAADSAIDMEEGKVAFRRGSFGGSLSSDSAAEVARGVVAVAPATAEKEEKAEKEKPKKKRRTPWPHASLIHKPGAKVKQVAAPKADICIFCKATFGDELPDLLPHLRAHLDELQSELRCDDCQVGFVHKRDLTQHLASADLLGHCGFNFPHTTVCRGHHPPPPAPPPWARRRPLNGQSWLTDRDRYRMWLQLKNWEQSQLQAYVANVADIITKRNRRASVCYSIEALLRVSKGSTASYAFSIDSARSAPCDRGIDGPMDVRGLGERLEQMSLRRSPRVPVWRRRKDSVDHDETMTEAIQERRQWSAVPFVPRQPS
ncbi:hypothetical protein K470DRAFT_12001 [Piedraia hortae CBS 480.64]|uniref:C2H2-type domain-containing protein n=1 Tax=Piedraia hortae CBS 480.64 TaxID=1314780 RepID=A0A6A7BPG4_9PEZI|nr:hypothetical protein K470DRAFT_12001 [Piedraia hortae CBS 480.64]